MSEPDRERAKALRASEDARRAERDLLEARARTVRWRPRLRRPGRATTRCGSVDRCGS